MKITYRILAPVRSKQTCKRKVRYGRQTTAEKARDKMAAKTGKKFDAYKLRPLWGMAHWDGDQKSV